jgi:hypothetical protein
VKDPDDRPTAAEVLKHPFLSQGPKSNVPIRALISEAKAEIVEVEEVCRSELSLILHG